MKAFLQPLQGLAEMEEIQKDLKKNKGILQISGCIESQKAHLMYGLSGLFSHKLILAEDERRAKEIYEDYRFYDKNILFYPTRDLVFFQADVHGNLLIRQRMRAVKALLEEKELTVVTSVDGCMDFLSPLERIQESLLTFQNDSELDLDKLKASLVKMGYERVGQVEMPGSFPSGAGSWTFILSQRKIPGGSNCGETRSTPSEALTPRASVPGKSPGDHHLSCRRRERGKGPGFFHGLFP